MMMMESVYKMRCISARACCLAGCKSGACGRCVVVVVERERNIQESKGDGVNTRIEITSGLNYSIDKALTAPMLFHTQRPHTQKLYERLELLHTIHYLYYFTVD